MLLLKDCSGLCIILFPKYSHWFTIITNSCLHLNFCRKFYVLQGRLQSLQQELRCPSLSEPWPDCHFPLSEGHTWAISSLTTGKDSLLTHTFAISLCPFRIWSYYHTIFSASTTSISTSFPGFEMQSTNSLLKAQMGYFFFFPPKAHRFHLGQSP